MKDKCKYQFKIGDVLHKATICGEKSFQVAVDPDRLNHKLEQSKGEIEPDFPGTMFMTENQLKEFLSSITN